MSSPKESYPFYLANRPKAPNRDLEVTDKFSGQVVTRVALAGPADIERAIEAASGAREQMAGMAAYERQAVLQHCVDRCRERADELASMLCIEAGKPIKDCRGEVTRLIDTLRIGAEEAVRLNGEVTTLDISPRAKGYMGMWKRVPVGVCSFITPFNFPLNLAAHKIAPALAAGCPFILKPADQTPLGALVLGEILAETELPEGAFSILPCRVEDAGPLVTDDRIQLLSFTGSGTVGWKLKARAGKKKVLLELGGNAACIVDRDADLADAVDRILIGAFYQSGQSCVSVQRILVHQDVYKTVKKELVRGAQALKTGDPADDDTFVGPLINPAAADRIETWIRTAVEQGATLLCGGKRDGLFVFPSLLEKVPDEHPLWCEEVFGPVAILESFAEYDRALERVNAAPFGLQAGVFTRDIYHAHRAWDRLEVGTILINEIPSWRVDHMPYGGVKESGLGREGIRFAMEEMTEIRQFILRDPGKG